MSGTGDGCRGVAPADMLIGADIVFSAFKNRGSAFGGRFLRAVYGGKDFIFRLNQLFGLFHNFFILRYHQGDCVSQIVGQLSFGDEYILILTEMSDDIFSRHVRRRVDAGHAGKGLCLLSVYGKDSGPGVSASHQAA